MAIPNQDLNCHELSREEAAYIAGFIDGEGCFQVQFRLHRYATRDSKPRMGYSIYLDIGQTQLDILEYLKERAGAGCIHNKPGRGNQRRAWILRIPGQAAQRLAVQIRPFLRVKAAIADVFLRFPFTGRSKDGQLELKHFLFEQARKINERGVSVRRNDQSLKLVGPSGPKRNAPDLPTLLAG